MALVDDLTLEGGLPANIDAEKTILGAILLDNEAFFDDSVELEPDDFSLDSHRRIYLRMTEILFGLVEGATHVDIVTLAHELDRNHELKAVGGVAYLASLTEGLPRRPVIEEYVRIIRDKTRLRRIMGVCSQAIHKAADQSQTSLEILGDTEYRLEEIAYGGIANSVEIGSCIPAVEERINKSRVISSERAALEMTWGLRGLDEFTHGAYSGEFTIISGEASGGKTAFAVQMTLANAREGIPCAWFSMEMPKEKVCQRYYAAMSEILTTDHIRDPRLMNLHTHIPEMRKISAELARLPIRIDDTSPLRVDKLRSRIRMMHRKFGTKLFIVDYLQLVKGMPGLKGQEQFTETVGILRDIPKTESAIHLAVLSQYSKADGFLRKKTRTAESNYGGSVIHHAAQNMLMISIEDPEKRDRLDLLDADVKIAKQREGKRGKITCSFDRDHLRFCYPQPQLKGA